MSSTDTSSDPEPPNTPTTIHGSCLCKSIKYTLYGTRLTCVICACDNCRRTTGSTFSHIQHYRDATLTLSPESLNKDCLKKYEDGDTKSGNVTERWFCRNCGSNLYGYSPTFKLYTLRVGAMDDECGEKVVTPMGASYPENMPEWVDERVRGKSMMGYPKVVEYFMGFMKK